MPKRRKMKYEPPTTEASLSRCLQNNLRYLDFIRKSRKSRWIFQVIPRLQKLVTAYASATTAAQKNLACAAVLDAFEETFLWRGRKLLRCWIQDVKVLRFQFGHRTTIDYSDKARRDYYSVAVIVKNEARYIREFILFYQATGADRIYIYDNGSTDSLLEELEPFLKSGLVVYRNWPGQIVQTAAYRDAIRRTRHRTKWLALIDADEFLFSPLGSMPEQLRAFEKYPGVGVNWLAYGPNGHDERPSGLVMDNYTTRIASPHSFINCHIKSIVQPKKVLCLNHVHFAIYRRLEYAVNECGEVIDNLNSIIERGGRAFTATNHRSIFRINHYTTKSLEDLVCKCGRGYADGAPNAKYEDQLRAYNEPLVEDYSIEPYADLVRKRYEASVIDTLEQDRRE